MLQKGLSYVCRTIVDRNNIAVTVGSGDLEVFATPSLVALLEQASRFAVAGFLPEGSTTVGSEVHVSHIRPTGIGDTVEGKAVLVAVDGRKLTFELSAVDTIGLIGKGTHIRYIVDAARFLDKLK